GKGQGHQVFAAHAVALTPTFHIRPEVADDVVGKAAEVLAKWPEHARLEDGQLGEARLARQVGNAARTVGGVAAQQRVGLTLVAELCLAALAPGALAERAVLADEGLVGAADEARAAERVVLDAVAIDWVW